MKLDYFVFASGMSGDGWAVYCPSNKSISFTENLTILGNSQLLCNSVDYINENYNENMKQIYSMPPQFTLLIKNSLLCEQEKKISIFNENYNDFTSKIKKEYLIKVGGKKSNKKWLIIDRNKKTYTKNNIFIFAKCETSENFIKVNGFFYKKSNIISYSKVFI
jgi:hypothetical protein